jgi:TRAP-type C4-dicarboxylate transport system permease small subunit
MTQARSPGPGGPDGPERAAEASPPPGALERAVARVVDAGAVIAGAAVVLILALVCVEVVMRGFNRSTMVADELAGYLNVAIVFGGVAYTLREGGFIRIEVLYERFGPGLRRAVDGLALVVSLAFVVGLGVLLAMHVAYAYRFDTRAVSVLQTPEWLPQSIMVLGCAVLALQLASYLGRRRRLP